MVCAEIGVQRGHFSQYIVDKMSPSRLYLIDSWQPMTFVEGDIQPYLDAQFQKLHLYIAVERFKKEIQAGIVRPIVDFSMDAVKKFDDEHLDFVYIDACHNTKECYEDITEWSKKVKSGGIVAGHDYHIDGPWGKCGVPEAVDRYAEENGLEINFIQEDPYRAKRKFWDSKSWWFIKP